MDMTEKKHSPASAILKQETKLIFMTLYWNCFKLLQYKDMLLFH